MLAIAIEHMVSRFRGATPPLRQAPVAPARPDIVRFAIWNTGDHWLLSTVLVDRFAWSADPTTGTKTDRPK